MGPDISVTVTLHAISWGHLQLPWWAGCDCPSQSQTDPSDCMCTLVMRRTLLASAAVGAVAALLLAGPGPAAADPGCEIGDPRPICNPDLPPVTDMPPVAIQEGEFVKDYVYRANGYMYDANGGPVRYQVSVDGVVVGNYVADQYHAGRNRYDAFFVTVGLPTSIGEHTVRISYLNISDGTDPGAPVVYAMAPYVYRNYPLPLVLNRAYIRSDDTGSYFHFDVIDQSKGETHFSALVTFDQATNSQCNMWERVRTTRDISANPGTGPVTLVLKVPRSPTGQPCTQRYAVTLFVAQAGLHSKGVYHEFF